MDNSQTESVNNQNESNLHDWSLGPDTLYPAESYTSTNLDDAVKIRVNNSQPAALHKPVSVYTRFKNIVEQVPNHVALVTDQLDGTYKEITYDEYWKLCIKAAKGFIKLGLQPSECVGVIGFNAPPWMITLYGTIFAGGIVCGMYTTNSAEACEYTIKDSGAHIVVVENKLHLDKFLAFKDTCKISAIIQYTGEVKDSHNGLVISWNEFLECGKSVTDQELKKRLSKIAPNKCLSLIYTSGTTGQPKAAMISHDNINHAASNVLESAQVVMFAERIVSYLPLSHIAAQLIDCFLTVFAGATLYFARPDVFKGTLTQTLTHAKPTLFFAVPRVWEKLEERISTTLSGLPKSKAKLFKWASKVSVARVQQGFHGRSNQDLKYKLANKLILGKVRKLLGLHKVRLMVSGAAPINKRTLEFFMGLGFPICEVFGMSECTGAHCHGLPNYNRLGSVGNVKSRFNVTKILNPDEGGNGELCMYGRQIFMGYLNGATKTQETIDQDGFLHSGDIAKIDAEGFLYITGRLKEIIITAGGENVAPIAIEERVKTEMLGFVSNCMVIGDNKKFLTMLITLKTQINLDTLEPMDELTDDCRKALEKLGSKATKVSEIIENKSDPVYDAITLGVQRANEHAVSNVARIKKFSILPRDFSIPTGELGNTFKLRRLIVVAKYADIIEKMYSEDGGAE